MNICKLCLRTNILTILHVIDVNYFHIIGDNVNIFSDKNESDSAEFYNELEAQQQGYHSLKNNDTIYHDIAGEESSNPQVDEHECRATVMCYLVKLID
jgi:hypothetical protein